MSDRPTWIRIQENGELGEARTRAFLLDRFWILERSIDIEGADFIIQRRLTERSLLDKTPPRLGYVQVKFLQDGATNHYVHKEYVLDGKGQPRQEFCLLCHTGIEDRAEVYFLTARDIADSFQITPDTHSKPNRFELKGSKITSRGYRVSDRSRVLSQIEQSLRNADFTANRLFMSWALPSLGEENPIKPEYVEPIENNWSDIPRAFAELREKAHNGMYGLVEALDLLQGIVETDDPEVALTYAEEFDGYGGRLSVRDDLFEEDFIRVVKDHKATYAALREHGLLGHHAEMRRRVLDAIQNCVVQGVPFKPTDMIVLDLTYDAESLEVGAMSVVTLDKGALELKDDMFGRESSLGLSICIDGHVVGYIVTPGYRPWTEDEAKQEKETLWTRQIGRGIGYLATEIMTAVVDLWMTRLDKTWWDDHR